MQLVADVVRLRPRKSPDCRPKLPESNLLVSALSGDFQVQPPDALQPFHLASKAERSRRLCRVLRLGWKLWSLGDRSIIDATREAAGGGAEGHYALNEMRCVLLELNLDHWEHHPNRSRRDVHALFRKAIGRLATHLGGWQVRR